MVSWQESLATIIEVLVHILVSTSTRSTQLINVGVLVLTKVWLASRASFIIHLSFVTLLLICSLRIAKLITKGRVGVLPCSNY